jgi:hypothetical protein
MAKKKNSRKALAVALGIMGVAGLSVASASTLNVTAGNEVGIGVDDFANCQGATPITVDYNYAVNPDTASGYGVTTVVVTGIATACEDENITLTLEDADENSLFTTTATAITGTSYTYTATTLDIDIETDLGEVAVIIG